MTVSGIHPDEWGYLNLARYQAGQLNAAGNRIAAFCLLRDGVDHAMQLCLAGVPEASSLYAMWNIALHQFTGCYTYLVTGEDEISYYPPGFPPW